MKTLALSLCVAGLAYPAAGQNVQSLPPLTGKDPMVPALELCYQTDGSDTLLRAEVRGGHGHAFLLYAGAPSEGRAEVLLGGAPLDEDGYGVLPLRLSGFRDMPVGKKLRFRAAFPMGPGAKVLFGVHPPFERIDFDHMPGMGFSPYPHGKLVSGEWSAIGLALSADNDVAGHPDLVAVFDSGNPSPHDLDLQTPGYGPGNDEALGSLLIIPENAADVDGDGILDDPDDEAGGGTMHFDFDSPLRMSAVTLVDVDDGPPTFLRFWNGMDLVSEISVPNAGDNSVQTLFFDVWPVTRFDVDFGGSGGVADVGASLCPTVVDFDLSTTGVPVSPMEAGTPVTAQYGELGITVEAFNGAAGHPDVALVFDTANPTGGDTDLATPGYGPGNDDDSVPSKKRVLVIAENDVDLDGDGVVDVPDDEAQGGMLAMDLDEEIIFLSAQVLDVDANESARFELYDAAGVLLDVIPAAPLGDNSLQKLEPAAPVFDVRRIELHMSGSGAWVDLEYCPQILAPTM